METDPRDHLREIERLDHRQHALELPKNLVLGSVVIIPSILLVTAYQRWDHGLPSKGYFVAAGVFFVVLLGLSAVLSIIQWVVIRHLIRFCREFPFHELEWIPFNYSPDARFGVFRLGAEGGRIVAQRPRVLLWRIHRPVLALCAALALIGYGVFLVPTLHSGLSVANIVKLVLAALTCIMTIWYARVPRVVRWEYVPESGRLVVQCLTGFLGRETIELDTSEISDLTVEPAGILSGRLRYAFSREGAGGQEASFPLPLDSFQAEPKTSFGRAEARMNMLRMVRFLHLIGHGWLIDDDELLDPDLEHMIKS